MEISVWTWGTGAAFGRELGVIPNRARRHHVATSIIGKEGNETKFHFLVDAGAPCVEAMVDAGVPAPDVVFITHPHFDHFSDLDKLANNRLRSLSMVGKPPAPLPVVCTRECLDHPDAGLKSKLDYLGGTIQWWPVRSYDVWYSARRTDAFLLPTRTLSRDDFTFEMSFLALPVYHGFAPGACLFIFRLHDRSRKIVISGDFESIEETVIEHPELKGADMVLLDTNTIKATYTNHTNWEQNKHLITRWSVRDSETRVLLNHIGGYEDYSQGYFDHIPTEEDWKREIATFKPPGGMTVDLAEDGKSYIL